MKGLNLVCVWGGDVSLRQSPKTVADFEPERSRGKDASVPSYNIYNPATKATEDDSWSLTQQVLAMKATEAPSLSFGDASPNDHEGASLNDQHHNRI